MTVNGIAHFRVYWSQIVDRFTDDVHHASQSLASDGDGYRAAGILDLHSTAETFRRLHCDCSNATFTQVLLNFDDDVYGGFDFESIADNAKRLIDRRQIGAIELHVD